MDIYEPAEDSYLLQKFIRKYALGRVLDLGTGSGIQAVTAANCPQVREIIAADINDLAIKQLQQEIILKKLKKINVLQSDLFEKVQGSFNLIIFNPPYLPQDKLESGRVIEDAALYGGKKGWEISEKFFRQASKHLLSDGVVLFLFSSLTNKEKIEQIISENLLQFQEVGRQKLAFEELYVYEVTKKSLLHELERKGLESLHYFAQGKRGKIFTADFDQSKLVKKHLPLKKDLIEVAVKIKRRDSEAKKRMEDEAQWLNVLNKKGMGPKLLFFGDNYLVYQFVEGKFFMDWLKGQQKEEIKKILQLVLKQCFEMDAMGLNKEEMHRPLKHIIIDDKNKPVLIDFERCYETQSPHNLTQFVEFICRSREELGKSGLIINAEKLRLLAKKYKEKPTEQSFNELLEAIS